MTGDPIRPAQALLGLSLNGGWTVIEPFLPRSGATGSTFSESYLVTRDGPNGVEQAFLKALDLGRMVQAGHNLVDVIQAGVEAYRHERDVVQRCADRRMSNVVRGVGSGELDVPLDRFDPSYAALNTVPYLVFEQADGDVRAAIERQVAWDEAWSLRMLHGVANGIRQLHGAGIAHQDLKPSNVMIFDNVVAKVGDLGQACDSASSPMFTEGRPGDPTYWPPEHLYRYSLTDADVRRRAYDLYHVGSMAVFLVCGSGVTALLHEDLEDEFHWRTWPRDYSNVAPYVRDSFNRILERLGPKVSEPIRAPLLAAIRELCEPDPPARGNPKRIDRGRYDLQRYVSIFDRLATRSEHHLTRTVR